MKEKEAKKIAAKKKLEEKNKRKTEEENAARKGEALQVSTADPLRAWSLAGLVQTPIRAWSLVLLVFEWRICCTFVDLREVVTGRKTLWTLLGLWEMEGEKAGVPKREDQEGERIWASEETERGGDGRWEEERQLDCFWEMVILLCARAARMVILLCAHAARWLQGNTWGLPRTLACRASLAFQSHRFRSYTRASLACLHL